MYPADYLRASVSKTLRDHRIAHTSKAAEVEKTKKGTFCNAFPTPPRLVFPRLQTVVVQNHIAKKDKWPLKKPEVETKKLRSYKRALDGE